MTEVPASDINANSVSSDLNGTYAAGKELNVLNRYPLWNDNELSLAPDASLKVNHVRIKGVFTRAPELPYAYLSTTVNVM